MRVSLARYVGSRKGAPRMVEWIIGFWFVFPLTIVIVGFIVAAVFPEED